MIMGMWPMGSNLLCKRQISVRRVTLARFAHTSKVEEVKHPSPGRMFGSNWLPRPLQPMRSSPKPNGSPTSAPFSWAATPCSEATANT
jgi:hypothetical protein